MYNNKIEADGRPNNDEIVMLKMLVLQQWHGLSDPELERQCISNFLQEIPGISNKNSRLFCCMVF